MPFDQQFETAQAHTPAKQSDQAMMPLGDHLDELRQRILYCLYGLVPAIAIALWQGSNLLDLLTIPYIDILQMFGYPTTTHAAGKTLGFANVYMPVVLVSAAILASPWIIYQAWKFIVVGLYHHERKAIYLLAPFSTIMAAFGVAFTYFVLIPVSLAFFVGFSQYYPEAQPGRMSDFSRNLVNITQATIPDQEPNDSGDPEQAEVASEATVIPTLESDPETLVAGNLWFDDMTGQLKIVNPHGEVQIIPLTTSRIISPLPMMDEYIRFAAFMTLGMVVAFQLPVIMLILGATRLLDPHILSKGRKYAVFVSAIAAALLTPTDIFSMIFVMVPLYGLYEMGLVLMHMTFRRAEARALKREMNEGD